MFDDWVDAGKSEAIIVKCDRVQVGEELRWKLTDVIGEEDGLGIECLSGSGAIARSNACCLCLPICLCLFTFAAQLHASV